MKKDIFKDAKFGDSFITRNGRKAIFLKRHLESNHLAIEGSMFSFDYDDDGLLKSRVDEGMDISAPLQSPFDLTFAVRGLGLLDKLYPDFPLSSQVAEEEFSYLSRVLKRLLKQQVKFCPESEKWYFENLCKDYKDADDILSHCVSSEFLNYLKHE